MSKIPIPEILRGKLVFGNSEQLKALREYERKMQEAEEEEVTTYYEVEVPFSGHRTYRVKAASASEAEALLAETAGESDDIDDITEWSERFEEVEWDLPITRKADP